MNMETALVETKKRLSEEELAALEKLASQVIADKSFARDFALNPKASLEKSGLTLEKLEGAVVSVVNSRYTSKLPLCTFFYFDDESWCMFMYGLPRKK